MCVYAAAENDVSIQNSSFQMANKLPASILCTQIYIHMTISNGNQLHLGGSYK